MEPNSRLDQPIPAGWNSFLYVLDGKVTVGSSGAIDAHNLVLLDQEGEGVSVTAGNENAELVIISGEPIGEPVAQHGPFVMNTRQEIQQAIEDYQFQAHGFAGAHSWQSSIANQF